MIFVDTNVLMYAVGRPHPLQAQARSFFEESAGAAELCTSTEVLQELLHAYVPAGRLETFDAALFLAKERMQLIFPIDSEDVERARALADHYPALTARDLIHLASCERRDFVEIKTFDRALQTAFRRFSR